MPVRRTAAVTLSATFVALALSACGGDEDPEYGQICIDAQTQQRVDDDDCDDDDGHGGGMVWFWYPYHLGAPAVGSQAHSAGSAVKPAGTYARVPASGGTGIVGKTGGVSSGG